MLGDDLDATLIELRAHAESAMRSRCVVLRKTGDRIVLDRMQVDQWAPVHVNLPFALAGAGSGDGGTRSVTFGDVTYQTATGVGKMPASTTDLQDDDVIVIVSGDWTDSAYSILKAVKKDRATARRVPIVEVDIPKGWAA